ncbi:TetR family transcriptional regulator [bacterium]|nr:TetR family transcriptional regulator [bacterium]
MGKKEKQELFYHVAEPLFERYGFRKTTVEDICREGAVSKRTFYELFSDKGDLFVRLVLYLAEKGIGEFVKHLPEDASGEERIHALLDAYEKVVSEHPVYQEFAADPGLIRQFGSIEPEMMQSPLVEQFESVLQHGIDRGEFRPMTPSLVTYIIFAILDGMFILAPQMSKEMGALNNPAMRNELRAFIVHALKGGQ